jgi:hypothetical protein
MMDFSAFDSRAAASAGAWLHLAHPATGELLYDKKKPCRVLVLGTESRQAQEALRAAQASRMKGDDDQQTLSELHDRLVAAAKPLIVGFENVDRGDTPAKAPDDVEWFLSLQTINGQEGEKSFVEQVMSFATKRANYLGNVSRT